MTGQLQITEMCEDWVFSKIYRWLYNNKVVHEKEMLKYICVDL